MLTWFNMVTVVRENQEMSRENKLVRESEKCQQMFKLVQEK